MTDVPRLLLVTDRTQIGDRPLEQVVAACVDAGFTDVFLRERDLPPHRYDELLARIRDRVGDAATILTRTGREDSVGCVLAEHAGRPSPRPGMVGRSVHDPVGIERARSEGADFVLAGPFAPTASKPGHGPALGRHGLSTLTAVAGRLPVLAIGGVRPVDLPALAGAGAAGAAVMGSLMRAADPAAIASEYVAVAAASLTRP